MVCWNALVRRRIAGSGWGLALALAALTAAPAGAEGMFPPISIDPSDLSYTTVITVTNGTDSEVTFNRASNTCVPDAPQSITLPANGSARIRVTQKHSDDGVDNCYLAHHSVTYQDAADIGNTFGIQQYGNSNDPACLDIKIFVIFPIGQAVCPIASGSVLGPKSQIYENPGSQEVNVATTCPGNTSDCRGQSDRTMAFGFYVSRPEAFAVTAVNGNTAVAIDCVLSDATNAADDNACVSTSATVPLGAQAQLSLAGDCNRFYRLADRTNVQLICTAPVHRLANGAMVGNSQAWPDVTNGGTFTLTGN
jgi:hypothetical protein